MSSVFIVSTGDGPDYRIKGVYQDKAVAERRSSVFVRANAIKEIDWDIYVAGMRAALAARNVTARPETQVAAQWWADQLEQATEASRIGHLQEVTDAFGKPALEPLFPGQAELFRLALEIQIEDLIAREDWRPEQPMWGNRVIGVDYDPSKTIADAASIALLDLSFRLPIKTNMWIDPGSVKVRTGYGAETVQIYPAIVSDESQ